MVILAMLQRAPWRCGPGIALALSSAAANAQTASLSQDNLGSASDAGTAPVVATTNGLDLDGYDSRPGSFGIRDCGLSADQKNIAACLAGEVTSGVSASRIWILRSSASRSETIFWCTCDDCSSLSPFV